MQFDSREFHLEAINLCVRTLMNHVTDTYSSQYDEDKPYRLQNVDLRVMEQLHQMIGQARKLREEMDQLGIAPAYDQEVPERVTRSQAIQDAKKIKKRRKPQKSMQKSGSPKVNEQNEQVQPLANSPLPAPKPVSESAELGIGLSDIDKDYLKEIGVFFEDGGNSNSPPPTL